MIFRRQHYAGRWKAPRSPRVRFVRHAGGYPLELEFTDGATGELGFSQRIVSRGGAFAALEEPPFFKQVAVDSEAGTIFWPNSVDFCPDVLYSLVSDKPVRVLVPA